MSQVSYLRVSSADQKTDKQLDGLTFDKEFSDQAGSGTTNRPGLTACLEYLREGDTLHVHSIDRLCRNLADLQTIVAELTGKGIMVHFHKENLIFSGNTMSNLMLQLLGAVSEFEKSLLNERQREGIAKAKAEGKHLGRKAALNFSQVQEIQRRIKNGEMIIDIAREHRVSRQTIYAALKRHAPPEGKITP